ncbi:MAG: hypothetical protein Q7T24_04890, partial [Deltaproteobacteria bacterium]|nr:hypothetical protein [Deltaproteobacteria bacterium]
MPEADEPKDESIKTSFYTFRQVRWRTLGEFSRLLKKSICFVGIKARHCGVVANYASFLAPLF